MQKHFLKLVTNHISAERLQYEDGTLRHIAGGPALSFPSDKNFYLGPVVGAAPRQIEAIEFACRHLHVSEEQLNG
jgi:hypothetical protein